MCHNENIEININMLEHDLIDQSSNIRRYAEAVKPAGKQVELPI